MEKKIEKIIKDVHCNGCETITAFEYIGGQEQIDTEEEIPLYNCSNCFTTKSLSYILENKKIII